MANVIVGVLSENSTLASHTYLLNVACLEKTNHSSIARLFDDSLKLIDPNFNRDRVSAIICNRRFPEAGKGLKVMYSSMIHLTCLAHGLHRVAEEIRANYSR